MATSYYFNKFYRELKFLLLCIGVWPYENGKVSKRIRYAFIIHGVIVLSQLVS